MHITMRIEQAPVSRNSEVAEGSVWEAMEAAAFHEVDDLVAILDNYHDGRNGDLFARRAQAYGWRTIEIDGQRRGDRCGLLRSDRDRRAHDDPRRAPRRGPRVCFVANHEGWHGKAMSPEQAAQAIEELGP